MFDIGMLSNALSGVPMGPAPGAGVVPSPSLWQQAGQWLGDPANAATINSASKMIAALGAPQFDANGRQVPSVGDRLNAASPLPGVAQANAVDQSTANGVSNANAQLQRSGLPGTQQQLGTAPALSITAPTAPTITPVPYESGGPPPDPRYAAGATSDGSPAPNSLDALHKVQSLYLKTVMQANQPPAPQGVGDAIGRTINPNGAPQSQPAAATSAPPAAPSVPAYTPLATTPNFNILQPTRVDPKAFLGLTPQEAQAAIQTGMAKVQAIQNQQLQLSQEGRAQNTEQRIQQEFPLMQAQRSATLTRTNQEAQYAPNVEQRAANADSRAQTSAPLQDAHLQAVTQSLMDSHQLQPDQARMLAAKVIEQQQQNQTNAPLAADAQAMYDLKKQDLQAQVDQRKAQAEAVGAGKVSASTSYNLGSKVESDVKNAMAQAISSTAKGQDATMINYATDPYTGDKKFASIGAQYSYKGRLEAQNTLLHGVGSKLQQLMSDEEAGSAISGVHAKAILNAVNQERLVTLNPQQPAGAKSSPDDLPVVAYSTKAAKEVFAPRIDLGGNTLFSIAEQRQSVADPNGLVMQGLKQRYTDAFNAANALPPASPEYAKAQGDVAKLAKDITAQKETLNELAKKYDKYTTVGDFNSLLTAATLGK